MKRHFYILLFLGVLFNCFSVVAQEQTVDQLKKEFKNAKHDTTRCLILNNMVNTESDEKLWPMYNHELLELAKANAEKTTNKKLKFIYLKHQADAVNNIGYIADEQGDIIKAIEYYNKALAIYTQIKNQQGIATSLNNIGFIYDNQGDIPKALEYYHKSLIIREQINDKKGVASTLNNLGYVYSFQGDILKAIEYHLRALKISKEIKNKKGVANALLNLGINNNKLGNSSKAMGYYREALKIQEEINNGFGIGNALFNIGSVYEKQGNLSNALDYYHQALEIFKEIKDKKGITKTLNNIACVLLNDNKPSEALKYAQKSMKIAKDLGYPEDIESVASTFKKIYQKLNQHKQAFEMYELEMSMRDSINNEETKRASIKKQFQYQYETKAAADSVKNAEQQKVKNAQLTAQQAQLNQEKTQRYSLYGGLLIVIAFALFVLNRFKITQRQKGIIEKQKQLVEVHQQEILDSITYAKRLQDAILPPLNLINENTSDFFVLYKPKDIVAGDFYWAEKVDDYFFVASADCTGHGVPGAMVSMVCCNALNRTVNEFGITETGKILDNVREIVLDVFKKSTETIDDGMDISLCRINLVTKEIQWSGANNPLWYIQNNELKGIKPNKQHIGKTDNAQPFTTHTIEYIENTTLYLFTDGLADQFGGPSGKKFKIKQFCDLLVQNNQLDLATQAATFDRSFLDWKGELEQVDDICVVGIRI